MGRSTIVIPLSLGVLLCLCGDGVDLPDLRRIDFGKDSCMFRPDSRFMGGMSPFSWLYPSWYDRDITSSLAGCVSFNCDSGEVYLVSCYGFFGFTPQTCPSSCPYLLARGDRSSMLTDSILRVSLKVFCEH